MPNTECRSNRFRPEAQHCKLPDPSFLVQCDYGAAELLLRHLYSSSAAAGAWRRRPIVGFDQTAFFDITEDRISLNLHADISTFRQPARTAHPTPSTAVACMWPSTAASKTLIGSTSSSSGTPATMLGRTQTTLSSCTRKPPHGTG